MIGTSLVRSWMRNPIQVVQLVRHRDGQSDSAPHGETIVWDPFAPRPLPDLSGLSGVEAAVHLSGANVAGHRWTEKYKREIVSSRVQGTRALVSTITHLEPRPHVLVCASAIGVYGDRGDEILTENSAAGRGFLAETCVAWET